MKESLEDRRIRRLETYSPKGGLRKDAALAIARQAVGSSNLSSGDNWRENARCYGVSNPDEFFKESPSSEEAIDMCERCPVRTQCLTDALIEGDQYGIWGGLTSNERQMLVHRYRR